jgi:hypothetical protein
MGDTVEDPITGLLYDTNNLTTPIDTMVPTIAPVTTTDTTGIVPDTSAPFNWTALMNSITGAAKVGSQIYLQNQTPSLIPGTQAIYNKATGQYYNPTTGQVVNPIGSALSSIPFSSNMGPILLYGGLALGAVLLFSAIGKH